MSGPIRPGRVRVCSRASVRVCTHVRVPSSGARSGRLVAGGTDREAERCVRNRPGVLAVSAVRTVELLLLWHHIQRFEGVDLAVCTSTDPCSEHERKRVGVTTDHRYVQWFRYYRLLRPYGERLSDRSSSRYVCNRLTTSDRNTAIRQDVSSSKRAPPSALSVTRIDHSWASTIRLTIVRPSPVPSSDVEKLISKTSSRSSSGIPGPSSST